MDAKTASLEEFLGAVLRGAAKIVGCASTHLILINEKTQEARIRLGAMAASYPAVSEIEQVVGESLHDICIPIRDTHDSVIVRAWRERTITEGSSFAELVGSALPAEFVHQLEHVVTDMRFISVPALSASRCFGVLLFHKQGSHPFSRQQREVILRYARRIGAILESDLLMGKGELLISRLRGGPEVLLFDAEGKLRGGTAGEGRPPDAQWLAELSRRVRAWAQSTPGSERPLRREPEGDRAGPLTELVPASLDGQAAVIAVVHQQASAARSVSLENQLLELTLGEVVPALFLDRELRITSCNDAASSLLGYGALELVGRGLESLLREPHAIASALTRRGLDPTNPHWEEAAVLVRHDETLVPARLEALALADDREEAVGFLVLLRERTGSAADGLERLVRQERLATMGEMAAQLAHELRNPVVAIGATLETLVRDPAMATKHREILSSVKREIVRMDMVLRDHLVFRTELSFTRVDLANVLDDARRLLAGAASRSGKSIVSSVPRGLVLRADHEAVKHLLFNLLNNALEAAPPDSLVECAAEEREHDVAVSIRDHGPGLLASAGECFQPFFTTKKNGTGLGLVVCQRIARAHGGLVDLRNAEGGGCQATVLLPLHSGEASMEGRT